MNYCKCRLFRSFISYFCRFDKGLSQKHVISIVFTDFNTQNYILFKVSACSLFLTIFLKFRKFQPRYAYKMYRGYYMAARRYEISLRVLKYFFNTRREISYLQAAM